MKIVEYGTQNFYCIEALCMLRKSCWLLFVILEMRFLPFIAENGCYADLIDKLM
jgi:hypothetical protein